MQALVIAHAAYGHNSLLQGQLPLPIWTDADAIIDYLVFAKNYIAECEERHGVEAVEDLLDSCHALMNYGVDRYKRRRSAVAAPGAGAPARSASTTCSSRSTTCGARCRARGRTAEDEEAPSASPPSRRRTCSTSSRRMRRCWSPGSAKWCASCARSAQYFYPQRQTQVMNEGWATFWHYTLLNTLYDEGLLADGFMMELLQSHTNVVFQPPIGQRVLQRHQSLRARLRDVHATCAASAKTRPRRTAAGSPISRAPTGSDSLDFAMRNFKDESFIGQFLSPKLMRDFRLFAVRDEESESELEVSAIHDDSGYRQLRESLSRQYDLNHREPNIQVWSVNLRGDRSLTLRHTQHNNRPLHDDSQEVLKHVARLWGFDVHLESVDSQGRISHRKVPGPQAA